MKSKIIGEKQSIPSETTSYNEIIKITDKILIEDEKKIKEMKVMINNMMCLDCDNVIENKCLSKCLCLEYSELGSLEKKEVKTNFSFKFWNCCKKRTKMKIDDFDEDSKKENKNIKNNINITDFEQNNKIYDKNSEVRINVNEKNEKRKNDIMNIINTQDFIEGFWEYNEQTKYVKEKYEKEYDLLIKNGNINEKIAMTILIIYYIEEECSELLNELSLIIIKAKKYIQKETKSTYDDIILNVIKLK